NGDGRAPKPGTVRIVASTEDGRRKLADLPAVRLGAVPFEPTAWIDIDPAKRGQTILGLGASLEHATCANLAKLPPDKREAVIESIVSPAKGIGMNLMRLCIGTSDFTDVPYYTYDDLPPGESDPGLERFSIERDRATVLPIVRAALRVNPELRFFASPWSPPAWMKTSGKLGTGRLKRDCFDAFARYLVRFVEAYAAEGVPILALTVQNEPQHQDPNYPTTLMSATDQRDFIRDHLGPLLAERKLPTQIWCWDHNWNRPDFPRTILSDPKAARYVDGIGWHHYEGTVEAQRELRRQFPDKHCYFTEGSLFGVEGALRLVDILRNDARSYNAWVILLDEHQKPNRGPHEASPTCIELLDDGSVRTNFDYFMQGQFMRHIPRGAVRLVSNPMEPGALGNVAFRTPDGFVVLLVANARKEEASLGVRCGGQRFVDRLPARSVATYVWRGDA
ncbi:MAG: glycoside hydrolase family 30 protein, partial [Armatimonadota bacterium]